MTGWGWAWMSLWTILRVAFVALLVLVLVRQSAPPRPRVDEDEPLTVLRRRFAAGELSDEQYEAMRRVLQQPSGT